MDLLRDEYTQIARNVLKSDSNIVWGEGNQNASIVLVGEAPGQKEEETQRTFVGAAGKNLNEFLEILELKREDIYITNTVKIRPYKIDSTTGRKSNRPPNKNELSSSIDVLKREIDLIDPKVVVTLGNVPLRAILNDSQSKIGELHGKVINLNKYVLFPLYHPASIIYNRGLYDTYIEDLHKLKEYIYKETGNGR